MSIHRAEWNFDKVPDEQKLACLYYELARESQTFRRHKEKALRVDLPDGTMWPPPKIKSDWPLIRPGSYFTRLISFSDFCEIYKAVLGYFPERSWPTLPQKIRKMFSSSGTGDSAMEGLTFRKPFYIDDDIDPFTAFYENPLAEKGFTTIRCAINWSYCDETIVKAFQTWVKNESKAIRKGLVIHEQYTRRFLLAERGRGFREVKSRLDDLSIARLLRNLTMKEAIKAATDCNFSIPHKVTSTPRTWRARKRRFKDCLPRYLSGIPRDEKPLSIG